MTRILHLTDLHFGAERQDLVAPLAAAIRDCRADLLVVSGDLTHRARPWQFRQAAGFLAAFGRPVLAVPGNHDLPLWNLPLRLMAPLHRWRRGVAPSERPDLLEVNGHGGRLRLFTADTADPLRIRSGVLRPVDVARIEAELRRGAPDDLNLLVCHHPIEEPPGFDRGETRGAAPGIQRLLAAGLHGVLTGHLHHWQIGLGITPDNPRALLQIQSGTALCGRLGEKEHGFALLDWAHDALAVTPWQVNPAASRFEPGQTSAFRRAGGFWHLASERSARLTPGPP